MVEYALAVSANNRNVSLQHLQKKMTTIPGSLAAAAAQLEPGMKVCDKITGPGRQLHLERQTHKRNPLLL